MSAYVVSDLHIATILIGARGVLGNTFDRSIRFYLKSATIEDAALVLMGENIKSINYRYGERKKAPKVISFVGAEYPNYAQLLLAIDSLVYQSSETKGWENSPSRRFLSSLTEEIAMQMMKRHAADDLSRARWSL